MEHSNSTRSSESTPAPWPFDGPEYPLDPPPEFARRRSECPVSKARMWDGSDAWVVTSYEGVKEVLLKEDTYSADTTRPGFPAVNATIQARNAEQGSFIRRDEPEHGRHRRMVSKNFMYRKVQTMRPAIERIVDEQIESMKARPQPADLVLDFAQQLPAHVMCELLDLPKERSSFFLDRVNTWMHIDSTPEESAQAAKDVLDYFSELIDERADNLGDDLVSQLISEQLNEGNLTREELLHTLHLLLIGGFDTTANMLALGTVALLENPDQLNLLKEDPELWPQAVEELLRYLSVVGREVVFRQAKQAGCLGDFDIAENDGVIAPLMAANRDPEMFPDPDRLDVTRNARDHLAFGFGVHQCLGQSLARLELQVGFRRLFEAFPDLALDTPMQDLRYKNATVYGVQELPVTW